MLTTVLSETQWPTALFGYARGHMVAMGLLWPTDLLILTREPFITGTHQQWQLQNKVIN